MFKRLLKGLFNLALSITGIVGYLMIILGGFGGSPDFMFQGTMFVLFSIVLFMYITNKEKM